MFQVGKTIYLMVLVPSIWNVAFYAYAAEDINSQWHPMRIAIVREAEHQCDICIWLN
ncbi:hypothetical protein EV217_5199 [Phyllobacterium myrsinacearum]|nr:hypothetical protein EV217_5199 [Phyllobacterium myrsinacearum]